MPWGPGVLPLVQQVQQRGAHGSAKTSIVDIPGWPCMLQYWKTARSLRFASSPVPTQSTLRETSAESWFVLGLEDTCIPCARDRNAHPHARRASPPLGGAFRSPKFGDAFSSALGCHQGHWGSVTGFRESNRNGMGNISFSIPFRSIQAESRILALPLANNIATLSTAVTPRRAHQ
jgi:hypothetical protein